MNQFYKILFITVSVFPLTASAVDFKGLINTVIEQLNILPGFLIGLAVLWFMWNVLSYIEAGDPKKREEAQKVVTYSIIAIFVMISVWGLVNIVIGTFNLDTGAITPPSIPSVN